LPRGPQILLEEVASQERSSWGSGGPAEWDKPGCKMDDMERAVSGRRAVIAHLASLIFTLGCSQVAEIDRLTPREAGIELRLPVQIAGWSVSNLYAVAATPPALVRTRDGHTWTPVALPNVDEVNVLAAALAADGDGVWMTAQQLVSRRSVLLRLLRDGAVEDHSAAVPPDRVLTDVRAGGGGVFLAGHLVSDSILGGLMRWTGQALEDVGPCWGRDVPRVLAVVGPTEAYLVVEGRVVRLRGGDLEDVPWPSDTATVQAAAAAPDDVWLWLSDLQSGTPALHRDAGGWHAFQIAAGGPDERSPPLGLVPLGSGRAGLLSLDCTPNCDFHAGTKLRSGLDDRPLDASGGEHARLPLMHCSPDGCAFGELHPVTLADDTLVLVESWPSEAATRSRWIVGSLGQWR
jgi:hypothetical protein